MVKFGYISVDIQTPKQQFSRAALRCAIAWY